MTTLIDVQNRCSRLNTVPALPRKPVEQVGTGGDQRLHLSPHGRPEALLGEEPARRGTARGRRRRAPCPASARWAEAPRGAAARPARHRRSTARASCAGKPPPRGPPACKERARRARGSTLSLIHISEPTRLL